jgi:hypothetical protein
VPTIEHGAKDGGHGASAPFAHPTLLDASHARGITIGNYFFDKASRAFVSFSSSSFC